MIYPISHSRTFLSKLVVGKKEIILLSPLEVEVNNNIHRTVLKKPKNSKKYIYVMETSTRYKHILHDGRKRIIYEIEAYGKDENEARGNFCIEFLKKYKKLSKKRTLTGEEKLFLKHCKEILPEDSLEGLILNSS